MADGSSKYPPEVVSVHEGPELGRTQRSQVISKALDTDYPLIDNDPHISRVLKYARPSDYVHGTLLAAFPPASMWTLEKFEPSGLQPKALASIMRLSGLAGLGFGFIYFYSRSINRFYGLSENRREIDMDMREMTDRVKQGLPLYGTSALSEYMQGLSHRNSRYTGLFLHVIPWVNFVNHPHHGVDTTKYYRQAELELEEARK